MEKLYRCKKNRMIAGVCAGLAHRFKLDDTIVRLIFLIATLAYGTSALIYVILWILMPEVDDVDETDKNENSENS